MVEREMRSSIPVPNVRTADKEVEPSVPVSKVMAVEKEVEPFVPVSKLGRREGGGALNSNFGTIFPKAGIPS